MSPVAPVGSTVGLRLVEGDLPEAVNGRPVALRLRLLRRLQEEDRLPLKLPCQGKSSAREDPVP